MPGRRPDGVDWGMDVFELERFVQAQDPVWPRVQAELRASAKTSHWMWFVFPQLAALGRSAMARRYGLTGLDEARAYLAHPVLGERLRTACELLLSLPAQRTALDVFGPVDAMKLRSCLTLFEAAAGEGGVFTRCLQRFCAGERDPLTLDRLAGC